MEPGQSFITKYGIVEVINDNRVIPTAHYAPTFKNDVKVWNNYKVKRSSTVSKKKLTFALLSLARRKTLNKYLSLNIIEQQTIFKACYGGDPRFMDPDKDYSTIIKTSADPKFFKLDPYEPIGSYPDRMVECKLIQDRRPRIECELCNISQMETTTMLPIDPIFKSFKLYIRRKDLIDVYIDDVNTFRCKLCGQVFTSIPGYRYHINSTVCTKKAEVIKEATISYYKDMKERSKLLFSKESGPYRDVHGRYNCGKVQRNISIILANSNTDQAERSDKSMIVKPAHILPSSNPTGTALEIKEKAPVVVIYSKEKEDGSNVILKVGKQNKTKLESIEDDLVSPYDVLNRLENEYYIIQGKMLGPMYDNVYKALGYLKPQKIKIKKKPKRIRKRKRNNNIPIINEENLPEKKLFYERYVNEPSIIDTRVFISEVDSGRYPSISRNNTEDVIHELVCALCHDEEAPEILSPTKTTNVLKCNFCTKVVHYCCMLKRFTVKEPEPEDEFMCHTCISVVLARRARAEKRRQDRLKLSNRSVVNDVNELKESMKLTKGVVTNLEYECLATQSRQINDLNELLYDAQKRLNQNLEIITVNNTRHDLINEIEQKATF